MDDQDDSRTLLGNFLNGAAGGAGGTATSSSSRRVEKGTIKVDPDKVTEELCTTLFANRFMMSRQNNPIPGAKFTAPCPCHMKRQAYVDATENAVQDVVKKTGRDVGNMEVAGRRQAAEWSSNYDRSQEMRDVEAKANEIVTMVQQIKAKAESGESSGGDDGGRDSESRHSLEGGFGGAGGGPLGGKGTPGGGGAAARTRNGTQMKRKAEEGGGR